MNEHVINAYDVLTDRVLGRMPADGGLPAQLLAVGETLCAAALQYYPSARGRRHATGSARR